MALRNEKMSDVEIAQTKATVSNEFTPEQYIETVAKIIAVKKLLDEQFRTGQVQAVEKNIPVAEVLGLGSPLTFFQTFICIEGDDLTNVEAFLALRDQLEEHSAAAEATAKTNANVAKARADYSLFKISQGASTEDRRESPDADLDEYPLEKITL